MGVDDVLAQPRRALPWLVVLAVIAASPSTREALASFFRRLLSSLRISRFGRPAVRKDFLNRGDRGAPASGAAARYGASSKKWGSQQAALPAPRAAKNTEDVPDEGGFAQYDGVLPPWLSKGLRSGGFQHLKPIQQKILPLALSGLDVCGVAPTGSGKTLAFLIPGLVHIAGQPPLRGASDGPIALVLAPTRELAVQIGKVAEGLLRPSADNQDSSWTQNNRQRGFASAVLYGGARRTDQLQTLRFQQCTHLIVATPGRLLDFLEHGAFTLQRCSFFVLDEGDRMLDFGFEPDVTAIAKQIRGDRQMLFFSATWPVEVEDAARRLCHNGQPFEVVSVQGAEADIEGGDAAFGGHALPPRDIHQVIEVVESSGNQNWNHNYEIDKKLPLLLSHLEGALGGEIGETPGKALIFVSTRVAAEDLGNLVARHFGLDRCGIMHGARKQDQREATLHAFRTGRIRALVATDVLGRGVDIPEVTHVVIYDFPDNIETYIHRVGRTGRNGQPGTSIAFFEPRHWYPDLAKDLVGVLRACGQDVPKELSREAGTDDWGAGWSQNTSSPKPEESLWKWEGRKAQPLESGSPDVATADELGEWHAEGARVWGYSANGGATEQGRMELRSGGKLRTTWGWGEWALLPSAPHCPPPSRRCPIAPGTGEAGTEGMDDASAVLEAKEVAPPASKPGAPHLSLSWGGCTDIVALDISGLGFELVSRSGRPANTYKKKTLGRAMPGITL